ncbi:hypothetical protein BOTBODRAFT_55749 [Botryobasidium botryosum FD-172 SS1]|uniref:F-box domain-containing protein n=1 Tax=Botryobasidium botryosum (strain FD-172 SS1) TaxID=930990 RepID=A0A067MR08_BOTB1|nr:hypothetical protein BOTBODRAFT_55749 [Botryobasidium botryosum FD-172 SS1]
MVARSILESKLSPKSLRLLDELLRSLKEPEVATGTDSRSSYTRAEEESVRFDLAAEVLLLEVSRIRAKRNSFSPINALPVELLSRIFLVGARRDIRDSAPLPLSSIVASHVCRRWRQISLSTPSLWTYFRPQIRAEWAPRAQGLPQDFLILPGSSRNCDNCESSLRNMRSLRVGSRLFRYDRTTPDLSSCMSFPAPNLTFLQLSGEGWYDDSGMHHCFVKLPSSPFQGQHKLQEVVISRCSLQWSSTIFSGLRRLSLHGIPDFYMLCADELLSILTACPPLEELSVSECKFMVRDHVPHRAVALPCLRSLLWDTDRGWQPYYHGWLRVLQYVLIPEGIELGLRCATSAFDIHTVLRENHELAPVALGHGVFPPIQLALSRCRHLSFGYPDLFDGDGDGDGAGYNPEAISLDSSGNMLKLFSRPIDVDFYTGTCINIGASLLMADFVTHLPPDSPIQCLSLYRARPFDAAAFIRVMHALPHLGKVVLLETASSCEDEILCAIADPRWGHCIEEIALHRSASSLVSLIHPFQSYVESVGKACVCQVTLRNCRAVDGEALAALRALVKVVRVENEPSAP